MVRTKRVLFVITPIRNRGGIIRRLHLWSKYLSPLYHIRILCYTPDRDVISMLAKEGCEVINSLGLGRVGRFTIFPGLLSILVEILRFRPSVIVSEFVWSDFLTSCAKLCLKSTAFSELPHLIHIAGDPEAGNCSFRNRVVKRVFNRLVSYSLNSCDVIITICQHDVNLVKQRYILNDKKIIIIPIGVEARDNDNSEKKELHVPFTFGVVSRLSPVKNIETIIRCFKEINNNDSCSLQLFIFGEGSEKQKLMSIVKELALEDNVYFRGSVANPYVAFESIDCLLMFSHIEGTPRAILEAAICGIPTVAKSVGGVGEIIQDKYTGYLVTSEPELISKMQWLVKNRQLVLEMGANARSFVSSKYLIRNQIESFIAVLNKIDF